MPPGRPMGKCSKTPFLRRILRGAGSVSHTSFAETAGTETVFSIAVHRLSHEVTISSHLSLSKGHGYLSAFNVEIQHILL